MKTFTGSVLKRSSLNTILVEVTRQWVHPKYKKTVKRTKKYLVDDAKQDAVIGQEVTIVEVRPLSKRKRFKVQKSLPKAK
jgi:small subunit ribosomal protein S17